MELDQPIIMEQVSGEAIPQAKACKQDVDQASNIQNAREVIESTGPKGKQQAAAALGY